MAKVTVTATKDFNDREGAIARRKGDRFEIDEERVKEFKDSITVEKAKKEEKPAKKPQDITMDKIQKDTEEAGEKATATEPVEKVKPTITSKAQRTGKSGQIKTSKPAKISKTKGGKRGK